MTDIDILSKLYLALGGMERRLDKMEFMFLQLTELLESHPEIDRVLESESYKTLIVDLEKRVYGKT